MHLSDISQQFYAYLMTHGLRDLLAAMLLGFIGYRLARILPRLLERALSKAHVDATLTTFVTNLSRSVLLVFITIIVLGRLGIETASLIAVLGAAGLAIGLALQGSLSNFAAGVLIIFFRPFRVGDEIEAGGATGTVQDIQIFTTVLHTADNLRIIVPNDLITKGKITNYSAHASRRLDLAVRVAPANDVEQVRQTLDTLLADHPSVLAAPAPLVTVAEFSQTGVQLLLQAWVKTADYTAVRVSLPAQIKRVFDQYGITTP